MKKMSYKHTVFACYIGYIVQAIVCNYAPLLFVTLSKEFNISVSKLTSLIIVTFAVQMVIDVLSARYVDKIGYRNCLIIAHILAFIGFIMLGTLPSLMSPYAAIMMSVIVYSSGSGLLEVLISPVVESCPTNNKKGTMSFLHSFYCWGSVFVILVSTLFFAVFGRENWKALSIIWSLIPLINGIYFIFVPIFTPATEEERIPIKHFAFKKVFILLILLMVSSGASEVAMSQWASAFAESGLNVSKTVGDLAGPCMFAVLMGISRVFYSLISKKINLIKYMAFCAMLCIISYIIASKSSIPFLSLLGCGLCGFSVGVMWPGTISIAAKMLGKGGTPLFAFLAMAGDIGCTLGPALVGVSSSAVGGLKDGMIFGSAFPIILIALLLFLSVDKKKII